MKVRAPGLGIIEVPLADLGSRAAALLLDAGIIALCAALFLGAAVIGRLLPSGARGYLLAGALGAGVGTSFLYFILFEGLTEGGTPGKRALGLQVVRRDGGGVGLEEALLRNLLRPVDLATGVGLLLIALTRDRQRLGDLVAGTAVARLGRPAARAPEGADAPPLRRPLSPPPEWVALASSFLARTEGLDPDRRRTLAEKLARRLDPAWGDSGLDAELFVRSAVAAARRQVFQEEDDG